MPLSKLFRYRGEENSQIDLGISRLDIESDDIDKSRLKILNRKYINKFLRGSNKQQDYYFKENTIVDYATQDAYQTIYHKTPIESTCSSIVSKAAEISFKSLDKPLPPTPQISSVGTGGAVKPPSRLNRIMSPLVPDDLHEMFSGAPHFTVSPDGNNSQEIPPIVSIEFPWDPPSQVENLRDSINVKELDWVNISTCDLSPKIGFSKTIDNESKKSECFSLFRCRQFPDMLSMHGLDQGTIGYKAALELPLSRPLTTPDPKSIHTLCLHRQRFTSMANDLRDLSDIVILNRLNAISEIFHRDSIDYPMPAVKLYKELSITISPRALESGDANGLEARVCQLIDILTAPEIWVDFSQEQWRIQLGQTLWAPSVSRTNSEENEYLSSNEARKDITQKYWFLLQILIGCEVILGLNALSMRNSAHLKSLEEILIEKKLTPSVKWTLLIARFWLENIYIEMPSALDKYESNSNQLLRNLKLFGRNQAQQISGLLHFAREIRWPNIKKLGANLLKISITGASCISLSESMSNSSKVLDYRHGSDLKELKCDENFSTDCLRGRFSDFYMSGFILPGESLSHLLISSVLENDADALSRLGCLTNPYGAFAYGGKSFWSSSNILGKILAAKRSSTECMGWVSSDVIPQGFDEGWIDLEIKPNRKRNSIKTVRSRIYHQNGIARQSHVIAAADPYSVLRGDFVQLTENFIYSLLTVKFLALELYRQEENYQLESATRENRTISKPNDINYSNRKPVSATIRFSIGFAKERSKEVNININNDVYFVVAHPCIIKSNSTIPSLSANSLAQHRQSKSSLSTENTSGHPLFKAYTYTTVSLRHILQSPTTARFCSLLSPTTSPDPIQQSTHTTSSSIPRVLVVDCTQDLNKDSYLIRSESDSDREVLARAVCAERGWNALISRKGRVCLSCSIREASALGYRVILRF